MKDAELTREKIQDQLKVLTKNPTYLTREQIKQRIQEQAKTNPLKRPKNVVWS